MESDAQRVVATQRFSQAEFARRIRRRLDIGAEQPVEHDQNAAKVPVQVAGIAGVVHAMVRRRVEDVLEWPLPDRQAGVQPVLVAQVEYDGEQHRSGGKPIRTSGRKNTAPPAAQALRPAEAISGGEIEIIGRMVHRVRGPQPADAVVGTVQPVVAEILRDHEQEPGTGVVHRNIGEAVTHGQSKQRARQTEAEQPVDKLTAENIAQRGEEGFSVVTVPAALQMPALDHRQPGEQQRRNEQHGTNSQLNPAAPNAPVMARPDDYAREPRFRRRTPWHHDSSQSRRNVRQPAAYSHRPRSALDSRRSRCRRMRSGPASWPGRCPPACPDQRYNRPTVAQVLSLQQTI